MIPDAPRPAPPTTNAELRRMIEQAQESLQAAVESVHSNPEAALDDLLAARLLLSTSLVVLDSRNGLPGVEPDRSSPAARDGRIRR